MILSIAFLSAFATSNVSINVVFKLSIFSLILSKFFFDPKKLINPIASLTLSKNPPNGLNPFSDFSFLSPKIFEFDFILLKIFETDSNPFFDFSFILLKIFKTDLDSFSGFITLALFGPGFILLKIVEPDLDSFSDFSFLSPKIFEPGLDSFSNFVARNLAYLRQPFKHF